MTINCQQCFFHPMRAPLHGSLHKRCFNTTNACFQLLFCDHIDLIFIFLPYNQRIHHPDYNNELTHFLPRTIVLKKPPGAQLGFNIRGGKASQLGIFISKVSCQLKPSLFIRRTAFIIMLFKMFWQVVPDSDAHRAGLQEGDQVLSVNDVDFQDIEHSRVRLEMSVQETETCWISPSLNRISVFLISPRLWRF